MILGIVFTCFKKTPRGRWIVDRFKIRFAIDWLTGAKAGCGSISRTLGTLQENGVPMLQALEIVKNIAGNIIISDAVTEAAIEVGKGHPLGTSLGRHPVFPGLFIQMVEVGEQSGSWRPC